MNRRPASAPKKISLPFLTCSGLLPPVKKMIDPINMTIRARPPAMPIRNRKKAVVKGPCSTGMQPSAESMCLSGQSPCTSGRGTEPQELVQADRLP